MSIDSTAQIHPSAVVERGARIGAGCEIGPFCWIGPHVELAENVVCSSHVVIRGQTKVGSDTRIFSFAVIGEIPQDLKFKGEVSQLKIGRQYHPRACDHQSGHSRRRRCHLDWR